MTERLTRAREAVWARMAKCTQPNCAACQRAQEDLDELIAAAKAEGTANG